MGALLIRNILLIEIRTVQALELVELALVRTVHHGRHLCLDLAARDQALEFRAGLGVIGHHLAGEGLDRRALAFCWASLLDSISNISLTATSLMKSSGFRSRTEDGIDAGPLRNGLSIDWRREHDCECRGNEGDCFHATFSRG